MFPPWDYSTIIGLVNQLVVAKTDGHENGVFVK